MFSVDDKLVVLIIAIIVARVVAASALLALVINWVLGTRGRYVWSSVGIALASYVGAFWVLSMILPPEQRVNGVPQDLRTFLLDHLLIVAAVPAGACLAAWQVLIRRRDASAVA
jgi:hypothetical protein